MPTQDERGCVKAAEDGDLAKLKHFIEEKGVSVECKGKKVSGNTWKFLFLCLGLCFHFQFLQFDVVWVVL